MKPKLLIGSQYLGTILYMFIYLIINVLIFSFPIGITNKIKFTSEGFNGKNNKMNNNHL